MHSQKRHMFFTMRYLCHRWSLWGWTSRNNSASSVVHVLSCANWKYNVVDINWHQKPMQIRSIYPQSRQQNYKTTGMFFKERYPLGSTFNTFISLVYTWSASSNALQINQMRQQVKQLSTYLPPCWPLDCRLLATTASFKLNWNCGKLKPMIACRNYGMLSAFRVMSYRTKDGFRMGNTGLLEPRQG